MKHSRVAGAHVIQFAKMANVFEVVAKDRQAVEEQYNNSFSKVSWEDRAMTVGNMKVVPFGHDNLLPIEIRETVGKHNLAPRIFTKRKYLTWGNGPILYTVSIKDNKVVRNYLEDPEILSWLKSWHFEAYLQKAIEDFNYTEGHFTLVQRNKGARIGSPFINSLKHISVTKGRLGYKVEDTRELPTHAIVGKWHRLTSQDFMVYPLWDANNPFDHGQSIAYDKLESFGADFYPQPDVVGSLPWIRRSTAIPFILQALSENSLHIKWHIISPQKYWDAKREILKEQCALKGQQYDEQMLEDLKDEIFEQLSQVLTGDINVGKFWHTEKVVEIVGNTQAEHKWELISLDQKIGDFVTAQLKIAENARFETIAGLGLHQALANIAASGKSDSGSEQLYALKNFMLSEVQMPEYIITKTINDCIAANWPHKKIALGFHREMPEREQDINPSNRVKNASTI